MIILVNEQEQSLLDLYLLYCELCLLLLLLNLIFNAITSFAKAC